MYKTMGKMARIVKEAPKQTGTFFAYEKAEESETEDS